MVNSSSLMGFAGRWRARASRVPPWALADSFLDVDLEVVDCLVVEETVALTS